jgi:hypothetical protein
VDRVPLTPRGAYERQLVRALEAARSKIARLLRSALQLYSTTVQWTPRRKVRCDALIRSSIGRLRCPATVSNIAAR